MKVWKQDHQEVTMELHTKALGSHWQVQKEPSHEQDYLRRANKFLGKERFFFYNWTPFMIKSIKRKIISKNHVMYKYSSSVPPPSTPDRCPCFKKTLCCSGASLSLGALYWYPRFFKYFVPNKTKVLCFPGAKCFCCWWGRGWTLQEREERQVETR